MESSKEPGGPISEGIYRNEGVMERVPVLCILEKDGPFLYGENDR